MSFQPFRPPHDLECPVCRDELRGRCRVGWTDRIAYGIWLFVILAAVVMATLAFYAVGYHVVWGRWPS